ncbi:MAG: tetratricopeptide repeat protein [Gemmataceae bacterium]
MDHPNIAKIFDGGSTGERGVSTPQFNTGERGESSPRFNTGERVNTGERGESSPRLDRGVDTPRSPDGRPSCVMELVRGVPITEFCDEHRLDPRRRLALFVQVCQAVQHAHQKGVIHRDLKPSNILVTLHDTVPVPKVIDFGIAKATTERLTDRTLVTGFAQVVGTPLYMSPEQAEMNGLDVDTRSDVYSLGVLLYELLTGTTPFDRDRLREVGYDELRRIVREEEPPRPSRQMATLSAAAIATITERRGVDARRYAGLLRGDLDWVVMKALEKDRSRRYESASALAADIERYLADEPVVACPPSAWYRLRKYARRHTAALAAAGVVAASLVAATGVSVWQAVKARDAQHRAESAEGRATTEAAIARAVNDFLQGDLLGQFDSVPQFSDEFGGNPDLTVNEAIDRAAAKISERFQDQPVVEAAIRMAIGKGYRSLTKHQLALPHFERALTLRQAHLGPDHADTLASKSNLAGLYSWMARHLDAIALRQQLLEYQSARLGPGHLETLACVCDLAEAYHLASRCEMSIPLLEQTLEKQRTIFGPTHASTLGTMQILAWHYSEARRFPEALSLYPKVWDTFKTTNDPGQEPPADWCIRFGLTCQRAGKLDQADPLLRKALEQLQKREDSVSRRAGRDNFHGWLALNLLLQERYDEAEPFIRQTVAAHTKRFPGHSTGFYWMTIYGAVLTGQRRYAEAEPLLLKGYEGMKQREAITLAYGWRHFAQAGVWIVRFYEVTNQPEKAREWQEKLAAAWRADRNP